MNESNSPSPIATEKPRPHRLIHRSTWAIITLALIALLLANLPGSYDRNQRTSAWDVGIQHGWPWVYLDRDLGSVSKINPGLLWKIGDEPKAFHPAGAVGDVAVGLAILLAIGILAEWRRRRRQSFWQITLLEALFAVVLLAVGSATWGWLLKETDRQLAALAGIRAGPAVNRSGYITAAWESRLPDWWMSLGRPQARPRPGYVIGIDSTYTPADPLLESLAQFANLRELRLGGARIQNLNVLENLQHCPRLQLLDLSQTGLTDEALDPIARVSSLVDLDLSHNEFTDEGLKKLQALKHLKYLDLTNTGASDEAVEALQQALPQLEITDD